MKGTLKGALYLIVAVLVIALVGACAKPAAPPAGTSAPVPTAAPAAVKAIKMRYSGGFAPSDTVSIGQKWFAEELTKRSNGSILAEAYLNSELYKHEEVTDAVSGGAVEIGVTTVGQWSGRNPIFGFYNYFFMLESGDHFVKAKDQLAKILFPLWEKQNLKPLHFFRYTDMCYIGNKQVIMPEDLKGRLVRGMNTETSASLKALGAVPSSVAAAEVYDALAKGAIDGGIGGWTSFQSRKQYEVAKNYTGTFFHAPGIAFMNLDAFNKLPKSAQDLVMQVAKDTEARSVTDAAEADKVAVEFLRADSAKKGGTFTILTKEQSAVWVKAALPTYDVWLEKVDKAGFGTQAKDLMKVLDSTR